MSQASPLAVDAILMSDLAKGAVRCSCQCRLREHALAAAAEYRNPQRDVPFASLAMIVFDRDGRGGAAVAGLRGAGRVARRGRCTRLGALAGAGADRGRAISILGTNRNDDMVGPPTCGAGDMDRSGCAHVLHPGSQRERRRAVGAAR
ncbi:hypothetical protein [Rhodanobacter lindaniclasticus]